MAKDEQLLCWSLRGRDWRVSMSGSIGNSAAIFETAVVATGGIDVWRSRAGYSASSTTATP
jgi:hypothetical protein